jgi:hypothetical protein
MNRRLKLRSLFWKEEKGDEKRGRGAKIEVAVSIPDW